MEENKKPHPPAWKIWILIIAAFQMISAVQSYWIHQQYAQNSQWLWESLIQQSQTVNDHIESANQYTEERIRLDKELRENLRQLLGVD